MWQSEKTEVNNCFWDVTTSNQPSSDGGTGTNTLNMKTQLTFTNWDFTDIWAIIQETTYPYLQNNTQDPLPQ